MATIVAAAAGGAFNTNATWVGGVKPTAADDAKLDATSGAVTVSGVSCVCRSLDMTGYASTLSGSGTLSIGDGSGGACTLAGTVSGSWLTIFKSTSNNGGAGWNITSNGKAFPGAVEFNGVGGKWILQDAFSSGTQSFTVTNGAFFANGKTMTIGAFDTSNTNTRTVDLTNSTVNCSNVWTVATTTNLTFVSTGSTLNFTGAGATLDCGSLSYNTVAITASGTTLITGANTFVNFTRTGTAAKTDRVTFSANQTVTGTLTLGGNTTQGVNRLLVSSDTQGTQRTITATGAAVVISGDVNFKDIDITGSPSWTNTGSKFVGDALGNGSLITTNRTSPTTQTATGTASFTWSTHGWTSHVPLPQDTVAIPNAFVAGRTITVDMPQLGADISFAGGSGSPILSTSIAVESYGSLTLVTGVAPSGTVAWTFAGRSTHTLTSAAATFTQSVIENAPSGTYTLQDAFVTSRSAAGSLTLTNGTLTTGNNAVTLSGASGSFSMTGGTLNLGSSAVTLAGTAAAATWTITGGTVNAGTSTITISTTTANTRTFAGGGQTYGTLTYTVAGSTGQLTITGANTFAAINFSDVTNARTLSMPTATATTITNVGGFNGVVGTAGKLMSVVGDVTSIYTQWTDYLSISSSDAIGPGWYAGANSTNGGGNTGWLFRARTPSCPNPTPRPRRALLRSAA